MWVLDTNTLIYHFKGLGRVSDNLLSRSPNDIAIPAVVLYELKVGIAKSVSPAKRSEQLRALVDVVQVLPFGPVEAAVAAQIRVDLEQRGLPIGPYDLLIAGTALSHSASLVTRNTREFKRVKKLQVESWY